MRTYTVEQAAKVLQVNPDTLRRLARSGLLPGSKIGQRWRFTERNLEQFLDRQTPGRPPPLTEQDLLAEIVRDAAP